MIVVKRPREGSRPALRGRDVGDVLGEFIAENR
jgi:hypothetical protein